MSFTYKPVEIVPRDEWGARPPTSTIQMNLPIKRVVFTYDTDTDECTTKEECIKAVQELQRRHMDEESADDIKYNFLVGGDGNGYEGRGYYVRPCTSLGLPEHHTDGSRLDIGYIGRYPSEDHLGAKLTMAGYDIPQKGIEKEIVEEFYSFLQIEKNPDLKAREEIERGALM